MIRAYYGFSDVTCERRYPYRKDFATMAECDAWIESQADVKGFDLAGVEEWPDKAEAPRRELAPRARTIKVPGHNKWVISIYANDPEIWGEYVLVFKSDEPGYQGARIPVSVEPWHEIFWDERERAWRERDLAATLEKIGKIIENQLKLYNFTITI